MLVFLVIGVDEIVAGGAGVGVGGVGGDHGRDDGIDCAGVGVVGW